MREWEASGRKYRLEKKIQELFHNFDEWYDSKLFLKHTCDEIDTEDTPYKQVIEELYGSRDGVIKYDFNAIGVDVLGRVYEQYLGYVAKTVEPKKRKQLAFNGFETLIKIEKEKRKRKEHGIYYTPKFVVDYIVQNTLGKFLEEKNHNEILNIKVLDPACGSGSFLTAAYDLLDKHHAKIAGKETGSFYDRIRILIQNIYGVDLDSQAVEISQLNLLLKTLTERERLPLLIKNIKEGNSLISGTKKELREYFGKNQEEEKPFNWEEEFPEVFKKGGFDVIIGNPPYVGILELSKAGLDKEKEYFKGNYFTAFKGYDLYVLFIERGISLLKECGRLGFIVPNKFMSTDYGQKLREFILERCAIEQMIDVSRDLVFGDVAIYPIVLILRKEGRRKKRHDNKILLTQPDRITNGFIETPQHYTPQEIFENSAKYIFVSHSNPKIEDIKQKIEKNSSFLNEICTINSGTTGFDYQKYGALITEELPKQKQEFRKFIITRNIRQYIIIWGESINYLKQSFRHPYFVYHKELVSKGKWDLFKSKKIVIRGMAKKLIAGFDNEGFALGVGVYTLTGIKIDIKYLLALLNSKIIDFYYKVKFSSKHLAGGYLGYNVGQLEIIPIRIINVDKTEEKILLNKVRKLVDNMMRFRKELQSETKLSDHYTCLEGEIETIDKAINQLVYKLYSLTPEEIKIVEDETREI